MLEGVSTLVVDLSDVVHLDVSAALAIEKTVVDMMNAGRSGYMVTVHGQPRQRLENMGILQRMPKLHVVEDRLAAIEHELYGDKPQSQAAGTSTASMYSIG